MILSPTDVRIIRELYAEVIARRKRGNGQRDPLHRNRDLRWAKITANNPTGVNDANANPVQWTYTIQEVYKSATGYGGWSNLDNGFNGTAYNFAEDANSTSGTQPSTGVDHDGADYPSGFNMTPLQNDLIVPFVLIDAAGAVEAWILPFNNGEDGTC